jgi:polar amino acid transport system ATP-binding protein
MTPTPIIQIKDVCKNFGQTAALNGVNLDVYPGEVVVVIGPSGSGKSTLLRCINRLEIFDAGSIVVDDIPLTTASHSTSSRIFPCWKT